MAEINNTQSVGAAANQSVKTKRDLALERLKQRHPDVDYPDDESMYGAINDDYDADQKTLEGYKNNEKALSDMFTSDPRSAEFLKNWKNGENPWTSLVREFGDDVVDYLTDPDNAEEVAKAQEDYLKRVTEGNKLQEEYESNMKKSLDVFDEFEKEYGEDTTNDIISKLLAVANDVIRGKFTKEALNMFRLAGDHDKDVADAAHEGEVKGRNANITKNIRLKKAGDGTADLDGKSLEMGQQTAEPDLGALGREHEDIWKAGNEKRIRRR